MAPPLMVVEREPPVPMPNATASVSPWMNLMLLRIDAEPVDQHLRLHRVVALAVRDRAGDEGHAAERIEADFGGLDGGVGRLLDGVGEADAAQHAALRRLLAPRLEAAPVGELHGAVHVLLEAAAVVGEGERRLVGHGRRRNGVAAPQLRRIDLHLVGGDVDQPLDHVGRLRPAGAAIGRGAVGVGQHAGDRDVRGRRGIDAAHRADVDHRRHGAAERHEGAEIAEAPDSHAEELAVACRAPATHRRCCRGRRRR